MNSKRKAELLEKLKKVRTILNGRIFERDQETDGILIAILTGSNTLFLGAPGAAKTQHINDASSLMGLSMFDILMSETVKTESIFGPTDIPALAQGKQQIKFKGYAPDSRLLFFDEIFKANGTVLNPLLWLINEHRFRDGDNGVQKCKIIATFAASNELPQEESLAALYDRFVLRYNISYMKDEQNVKALIERYLGDQDDVDAGHILSEQDVDELRELRRTVQLPDKVRDAAIRIRRQVEMSLRTQISDRRFLRSLRAVQGAALLAGRTTIQEEDLEILAHIFWNTPEEIVKVQNIVFSHTCSNSTVVTSYLERATAIKNELGKTTKILEAIRELKRIIESLGTATGRFAQQARSQVLSILGQYRLVYKDRKTFQVIRAELNGRFVLKVVAHSANVWTNQELRGFGLRVKRKGNYWYYDGSELSLKKKLLAKKSVLKVASLDETNAEPRAKNWKRKSEEVDYD